MEFKGTKGEWELFRQDDDIYIETKSGNAAICSIVGGLGLEQDEANALLISKAPEMLEMLKEIKNQIEDGRTYVNKEDIEQLIKQATEL